MGNNASPIPDGRWVQVFCHEVRAGRTCGEYLGAICLDMPHRSRKYCNHRHEDGKRRLTEYRIDSEGHVRMKLIPPDIRKEYFEDAIISVETA